MKIFVRILGVIGVLLATSITYCTYGFATAEGIIKKLCSQINSGMPISELRAFSDENGLMLPRSVRNTGIAFINETRTFGRFDCMIILETGRVKNVKYNFLD
jgi:hypothetical protein